MGSISFTGNTGDSLFLGGVASNLYPYSYDITVKNCANYGDVTHSGESSRSCIGGIIGDTGNSRAYIYNSLNQGAIKHNGKTTGEVNIGGIVGYTVSTTLENCVSAGKISFTGTGNIGSIVGYIKSDTTINYCYFSSELNNHDKYGYIESTSSESYVLSYNSTFELDESVSIGSYTSTSLIVALNTYIEYYAISDFSHWFLNKDINTVNFTINNDRTSPISMDYQIILLPSLANEGNIGFDGWYEDST